MKKLVFGLVAILAFSFVGKAQTKEEARQKFASTMQQLVEDCRPSYKKGMSYDDFIKIVIGGGTGPTFPIPTEEGQLLMGKAYSYVSTETSSSDILKNYNGYEVARVMKLVNGTKTTYAAGELIFGKNIIENTTFGQNLVSNRSGMPCCKWLSDFIAWYNIYISLMCVFVPC
jgi:hypothetical protein